MKLLREAWAVALALSTILVYAQGGQQHQLGNFSYNRREFLLNDEPFQIIGGQMDPQRIPPEYWTLRLQMARAMGLNTVFSYIFWNLHEPNPGAWDFTGRNDVARFFRLAHDQGLHVVLRPGPYICGERDWGGLPAWLSQVPGMAIRQDNRPFLDASRRYLDRIGRELRPLQVTAGGPILMVQLENEYGSFGTDKNYLAALAASFHSNFDLVLYTNDGGGDSFLRGGQLHGLLAVIDGDPKTGFAARDKYVTDPTSLGPLLDGEYYITKHDQWGSDSAHNYVLGSGDRVSKVVSDLDWILSANDSFSIYMFHGATNFGFENGGIRDGDGPLTAVTSSYDFGAPLDESGRPTDVYFALRDMIARHTLPAGSILKVPAMPRLATVPKFGLRPVVSLFATHKTAARQETDPVSMDALGQSYGYVLYEHTATQNVSGNVTLGDGARDRAIIYVNEARVGVIDTIYKEPAQVHVALKKGDALQILVENLGRVDVRQRLRDQVKGIVGRVSVGADVLDWWSTYSMPLDKLPTGLSSEAYKVRKNDSPVLYAGSFDLPKGVSTDASGDTFMSVPEGIKGVLWVNGINIGRFWAIGPQQSLYVPGSYLKEKNDVVVLELEPKPGVELSAEGIAERRWFNKVDPDAP